MIQNINNNIPHAYNFICQMQICPLFMMLVFCAPRSRSAICTGMISKTYTVLFLRAS